MFQIQCYALQNGIKDRVAKIEDPVEKMAYIDCLKMNYSGSGSDRINQGFDIASALLSGSYLGVSIYNEIADNSTVIQQVKDQVAPN